MSVHHKAEQMTVEAAATADSVGEFSGCYRYSAKVAPVIVREEAPDALGVLLKNPGAIGVGGIP